MFKYYAGKNGNLIFSKKTKFLLQCDFYRAIFHLNIRL